jgi:DNA-binding MarR family transcriptional regulator
MTDQALLIRAAEFADIIHGLRQRFHQEQIEFLNKTKCLSIVQLDVLLIIAAQQPCTMGQVAKKVPSLSLSSITVIVDKLVKAKFVSRVRCEEDRRVVRVELTEEGQEVFKAHRDAMVSTSTRLMSQLSEEEQEFLLKTYRKIAAGCIK